MQIFPPKRAFAMAGPKAPGRTLGLLFRPPPTGTTTNTNVGWTAGGGLEFGIDRNWSAKLEYLHVDLGTATLMGSASGTSTLAVPITNELVRAGVNYRW